MYLEDSFIKRYYSITRLFLLFSLIEGFLFWFSEVSFVNFVYLLFEIIWLFYSIVIFGYIFIEKLPLWLFSMPSWYLFYFATSLTYTIYYKQLQTSLDKDIFIRNNALILVVFSLVGFLLYVMVKKKFFTKLF